MNCRLFRSSRGRAPRESELAVETARENLKQTQRERNAVRAVTSLVQHELEQNHISQRISILLREGK